MAKIRYADAGGGLDADPDEQRVRRRVRPIGFWLAGSFVLFCLGVTAFVYLLRHPELENLVRPKLETFRVQSRSMEPSWRGPRFEATCPECGGKIVTSLDITSVASDVGNVDGNEASPEARRFRDTVRTLVCPNCGFDHVDASGAVFKDGDLLRVLPIEATGRKPERWDVAIFRDPQGVYTLKRLVGLPGELVEIRNGDVWIDGKPTRRTAEQLWNVAEEIQPSTETKTAGRLFVSHVVNLRRTSTGGVERVEAVPAAISNESSTPCFDGDSGPVELVRDFLTRFCWDASGAGGDSLTILVRRPESAWALEYAASSGLIVARALPLVSGRTVSGKAFEELDASDFAHARSATKETPPPDATAPLTVTAMAVDGELVFSVDDEELARFALGDVESVATAAISTPFVILGDVSRASSVGVYRDLHYSSADWVGEPSSEDGYYALGDNSPASRDSRFFEVGAIPAERVRYIAPPSKEPQ